MYCLFCGTSLPEEAPFCLKCGTLTPKRNGESGHTPTFTPISSPSAFSSPRPSTSYGPLPPEGDTQRPYAPLALPPPPRRRRSSSGVLKGLFCGILVVLLLSGGWLLLKPGVFSSS